MSYRRMGGCAAAVVLALAGAAMGASGAEETVVLRIAKSELVGAQSIIAPTTSIDYGSYEWIEVTAAEALAIQAAGLVADVVAEPYTLILGQLRFDPMKHEVILPDGLEEVRNPSGGKDLQLVQFNGPVKQAWLDEMKTLGMEPVQYVHPNTYIMWGAPEARGACVGAECVRWSGPFAPAYRLLPSARALNDEPIQVHVSFFKQADLKRAADAIHALGAKGEAPALNGDPALARATYTINGSLLADIARVPGVYSVQPVPTDGGLRGEMTNQINVNNVDGSNAAFPGYLAWLSSVGFDGAGVVMANVDGGISDTHPDLVNRMLSCVGSTCGGGASSTHGTHTAGIMAGDGSSGTTANGGFLRALGMAPGANLVEQVYSPTFTQPNGMFELMKQSSQNGAVLSGNSWGPAGTPQGYDDDTRQVDVGARDAEDGVAGNQEFLYVLSFMNGGGGTQTQGSPDEAKNIFTIGSTKGQNSGSGSQILDIDDLSSNSAHGPALDGREIPHIVAPGCYVDSALTSTGYGLNCGTSMASPHVAGASGLFFEYYRSLPDYVSDPSPALVKAAFCAVARNLAGNLDADGGVLGAPFDSKQGWGRLDAEAVIDVDPDSVRYFDQEVLFDNTGEEWSTTVSPFDAGQPMRIMLVWTDAPGHGLGGSTPAWNNNLDLVVEVGASTYRGNNFNASGFSTTGGTADDRNNTEGVFFDVPPGAATIRVIATDINSDGVPNVGDGTDQDFALVCYNCAVDPGFGVSASPSSERVCAGSDAVYTVDVSSVAGFTDPVTLAVMGAPAGSSTNISPNPVTPGGSATVTISSLTTGGTSSLVFEGTSGAIVRTTGASLIVDGGAPGAATLVSPGDGATGVILQPTLDWATVADAASYDVELANDAGFTSIVASGTVSDSEFDVTTSLAISSTYYWRVTPSNTCGTGATSSVFSFTTIVDRPILLVDDDDNATNVQPTYTAALDNIGLSYDVWDTNNTDNEPDAAYLANYSMVIWFTGHEFGGFAGPGPAGEAALGSYLDDGGCLLMTSQDYLYDRGVTAFLSGYMGIASHTNDTGQTTASGAGLLAGMGPYALNYPYTNFSDVVNPDGTASVCFTGDDGNAGVHKQVGGSVRVFMGFPLEAIPNAADREAVIQAVLAACEQPVPPCPWDLSGNGIVDLDDLNEVLFNFGNTGAPGIPGDANGDGLVDLDDLNGILFNFGTLCPA